MSTITKIAEQIKDIKENIILIYAFNGTGKTRTSMAFKDIGKKVDKEGNTIERDTLYFNAFTEDLFTWDNDIDNGEQNIKLDIKFSSLNQFHGLLTEEKVNEKLRPYKHKYEFDFISNENPEKGYDAIHFYKQDDEAINDDELFTYHFVLLRQLLENIVSFLGKSQIKLLLEKIKVDNPEQTINIINSLSHKRVFVPQFNRMNEQEKTIFKEVLEKLKYKYNFQF